MGHLWISALSLLLGCVAGSKPPPPPGAGQVAGDSAAGDSAAGDSAVGAGTDTGGTPAALPYPVESDIEPRGEMACDGYDKPCNHKVMVSIDEGSGWSVLDFDIALRASVPDATYIDHGEIAGVHTGELRIFYVDEFEGNQDGGIAILSTASLAFPVDALTDAASAGEILSEQTAARWVYRRTNAASHGGMVVDPNLEVIRGEDGALDYYLVTLDLGDLKNTEPIKDVLVSRSDDGITFELVSTLIQVNQATDPDPFPLDYTAPYPGVLPSSYGLGGSGRWGMHLSQGTNLDRYDGDLSEMSYTGPALEGASVSGTSVLSDGVRVYAHQTVDTLQRALSAALTDGDTYGGLEVELQASDSLLIPLGVSSPGVVPIPNDSGVRLMFFHTRIDESQDL